MEEENESSNGIAMVPLALSILAVVLGGAGLYFGLTANQRLTPISESMEAGTSSTARLEKGVAGLETKLAELGAQTVELKKALDRTRVYSNQSERAVKTLAGNVQENRDEIVKMAGRLNEMISGGARLQSGNSGSGEAAATAGASTTGQASGPGGTYTIQSGDTFAKVASKTGVGLQALLDANPGTDPRRLRIGQVINLPGE